MGFGGIIFSDKPKKIPNLEVQHEQFLRGYSIGYTTIRYQKNWIYVTNKMNVFFVLENQ
jgi:hypothetical protein